MMRVLLMVLAGWACVTRGLENGLARTPPMGWMSWERFRCQTDCVNFPDSCINDKLYMAMADRMVADGYKDAGYEFVNIDDCWLAKERDPDTLQLVPDPQRFPNGIKALADYMHSKGLKLGIYEDFGSKTCAGYPGSEFFMEKDANTFAAWQVDMLKFDGCNSDPADSIYGYPTMQMYLNKTGRPIVFSCEWPLYDYAHKKQSNYTAIRQACNLWRNYEDVTDSWENIESIIRYYAGNPQDFSSYAGPGGWTDPDELIVGDFGLSISQQKVHFGLWAMWAAPLIMSNDLRSISQPARDILLNRGVIAINQDPLGAEAKNLYHFEKGWSTWIKPLSGKPGTMAIAVVNLSPEGRARGLNTTLGDMTLTNAGGYNLTDVFQNTHYGVFKPSSPVNFLVDPTSILILKADPL